MLESVSSLAVLHFHDVAGTDRGLVGVIVFRRLSHSEDDVGSQAVQIAIRETINDCGVGDGCHQLQSNSRIVSHAWCAIGPSSHPLFAKVIEVCLRIFRHLETLALVLC